MHSCSQRCRFACIYCEPGQLIRQKIIFTINIFDNLLFIMNQLNGTLVKTALIADALPKMPWEPKPAGCKEVVWRHSANPIIDLHPFPKARSVFNSCVIPWDDGFIGVFRVDSLSMDPNLHLGTSPDGINWTIEEKPIDFISPDPALGKITIAYDPRLCKIEDKYYITWCNAYYGATIGQAWTTDFKNFHQMENAFLPFNRNGVLFPKKIGGKYAMLSRPMGLGMAVNYGDIFFSESPDLTYWGKHRIVFTRGPGKWERVKIGPGPIPIETSEVGCCYTTELPIPAIVLFTAWVLHCWISTNPGKYSTVVNFPL